MPDIKDTSQSDIDLVTASTNECKGCVEYDACWNLPLDSKKPCALAFVRIRDRQRKQLADLNKLLHNIGVDALRECALDMGIKCERCKVDVWTCVEPCENTIADFYWNRAEARS